MAELESRIQNELNDIGNMICKALRDSVDETNAVATGNLKQSIDFNAKAYLPDGDVTKLKIVFEIFMSNLWYYSEYGRKAGRRPPIDPIIKWLKNKDNFYIGKEQRDSKGRPKYKSIAYMIAKKIGDKGTRSSHFFSRVVNNAFETAFRERLEKLIGEAIEIQISNIIEQKIK